MPAGAAGANLALPGSFAGFGGLPKRKVAGTVFFIFVHVDARAVFHAAEIFFREFAVSRKTGDAKVIRTIFGTIGKTFLH